MAGTFGRQTRHGQYPQAVTGETKVQEAFGKWEATQDLADLQWPVIDHLPANQARLVARLAAGFQALDSMCTPRELLSWPSA
ncbi:hypothetical protein [Zoogloea sp. LCSB751]|uniref:hypothetical protein n=1 Tax=Zoogloea sp. LCSB751 TaxID=1965277 RepID=UPI001C1F630B|nr:hypothetical protein [Zoogloea sp. LCSB751]